MRQIEDQQPLDLDLAALRLGAAKAMPGVGRRPACTRSASAMPSSRYMACRPRLLSNAICTASSIDSAFASNSRTALVDRVPGGVGSGPLQILAEAILGGSATGAKPPSGLKEAQPPRKAAAANMAARRLRGR